MKMNAKLLKTKALMIKEKCSCATLVEG